MESFGVLFNKNKENEFNTKMDLHINLWNIKTEDDKNKSFIDIGIRIQNYKDIDSLKIVIPFEIEKENIIDLSDTLKEPDTISLIFNENYEVGVQKNYTYVKQDEEEDNLLIYNFKTHDSKMNVNKHIMSLDLGTVKNDPIYKHFNNLYIRFRIDPDSLNKILFCKVQRKNQFLESGFTSTQILDLKINKQRNISSDILESLRREGYEFCVFEKIHFLIMQPANDDVLVLGKEIDECRTLEENRWSKYLINNYKTNDMLVYHCKNKKEGINEYSQVVKITSAKTNIKLICIYILSLVVIGVATNTFYEHIVDNLVTSEELKIVASIIFLVALLILIMLPKFKKDIE